MDIEYLGSVGLIILFCFLLIVFVPIMFGVLIAYLFNVVNGMNLYIITIGVAVIILILMFIYYFK